MVKKMKKQGILLLALFTTVSQILFHPKDVHAASYSDGIYIISSAIDDDFVWDITGAGTQDCCNLQLYTSNNTLAQQFYFEKQSDGSYKITNVNSGKVIDCAGGGQSNGTNLQQYGSNDTSSQRFEIKDVGNGYVAFQCKCNGLYVDVSGGIATDSTNIQMYEYNGTAAQKFKLTKKASSTGQENKDKVSCTYKTVTLNSFSTIEEWTNAINTAEQSLVFGGQIVSTVDGQQYYTGKIILDKQVVSTKTVKVKVPVAGPNAYKTVKIRLPKKIKYKLHTHNFSDKAWERVRYANGSIVMTQQYNCGFYSEWYWEIPLFDADGGIQNTKTTINALPRQQTLRY